MEPEFFPPLPDPAENQPTEARRAMGQRLIKQAGVNWNRATGYKPAKRRGDRQSNT